ncbi:DUF590-domain-containing protein [Fomitiporia mediterranea MF3/22]|uniref:DUF590-domain-containing protein n=1 Tax=Fomitiporia mediterranea (strain MF3/22) TaxID=694068 RepID=UPI0004409879|nr:DUF590-domain-containing protein [Fomitiporia mediterranea MF3/22]EJD07576.1 DUF590-domain-containing protein [Fomitiporia mediterranea MF3/22]
MAHSPSNSPKVDLILVFRASNTNSSYKPLSKQETREDAQASETEYTRLLETLRNAGLRASGKRGQKNGQLLIFVWSPATRLAKLVQRERYSDFLRGLPTSELLTKDATTLSDPSTLSPADRLRIVYEFVTSTPHDGGLGVVPGSPQWPRVESVLALHDREFNDLWLRSWTRRQIGFGIGRNELDKIKDQFGEAVALYFAFLSSYTTSLVYIAALGTAFYLLRMPYSAIYSTLLMAWSIFFVEFWRIRERTLSVRWGTRGSFRVERRRAQYKDAGGPGIKFPWWKRDARIFASLPVILLFAAALAALLTAIFIFEAFVTQLYTGPGQKIISFSPTLLFVALVPRLLQLYQSYAVKLTDWENHAHESTYEASLTIKTFTLSAIVAYLGLALSAFVYMPFGEQLMASVSRTLFVTSAAVGAQATRAADFINTTAGFTAEKVAESPISFLGGLFGKSDGNGKNASVWANSAKTDPARLQNQMFAYTVTQQVVGTFTEVGLPFVMRKVEAFRSGSSKSATSSSAGSAGMSTTPSAVSVDGAKKSNNGKRVVFEDEERGDRDEREFLARVRHEASLPPYTLFADFSEMVTQFGYVSLWSTIWPLAPVMALLNNWLELRSDAFKIATNCRRPLPFRTDTIGPWVDTMSFIAWLSALTNSALVYLFSPDNFTPQRNLSSITTGSTLDMPSSSTSTPPDVNPTFHVNPNTAPTSLLLPALLVALSASHLHTLARLLIRHILERALWKGSEAAEEVERCEREVKGWYLRSLGVEGVEGVEDVKEKLERGNEGITEDVKVQEKLSEGKGKDGEEREDPTGFWTRDEGMDEIRRAVKDA